MVIVSGGWDSTRSRVFLARSLTKGWAIGGILVDADMVVSLPVVK